MLHIIELRIPFEENANWINMKVCENNPCNRQYKCNKTYNESARSEAMKVMMLWNRFVHYHSPLWLNWGMNQSLQTGYEIQIHIMREAISFHGWRDLNPEVTSKSKYMMNKSWPYLMGYKIPPFSLFSAMSRYVLV